MSKYFHIENHDKKKVQQFDECIVRSVASQ